MQGRPALYPLSVLRLLPHKEGGTIIYTENIAACCDLCGEPIYPDDKYYTLPDGTTLCTDTDCLEQWLESYICRGTYY